MHSIRQVRLYVTLAVRGAAVVLLLVGVYGLLQLIPRAGIGRTIFAQEGERGFMWLGFAAGFLIIGAALALASSRLVRWAAPVMADAPRPRVFSLLAVRLMAIALLLVAVYGAIRFAFLRWSAAVFGLQLPIFVQYEGGFTWLGFTLGYLAAGLALALLSGPLARWLVPAATNDCPRCGYELKKLTSERCPECGLEVDSHPARP